MAISETCLCNSVKNNNKRWREHHEKTRIGKRPGRRAGGKEIEKKKEVSQIKSKKKLILKLNLKMSSGSDSGSDYEFGKRRKKKSKQKPAKRARSRSPPGDGINTCLHCRQTLVDNENLRFHQNVPEGAKEELEIIFEVENFSEGDPEDPRPEFRATQVF